jgi:hypothetical protein
MISCQGVAMMIFNKGSAALFACFDNIYLKCNKRTKIQHADIVKG